MPAAHPAAIPRDDAAIAKARVVIAIVESRIVIEPITDPANPPTWPAIAAPPGNAAAPPPWSTPPGHATAPLGPRQATPPRPLGPRQATPPPPRGPRQATPPPRLTCTTIELSTAGLLKLAGPIVSAVAVNGAATPITNPSNAPANKILRIMISFLSRVRSNPPTRSGERNRFPRPRFSKSLKWRHFRLQLRVKFQCVRDVTAADPPRRR